MKNLTFSKMEAEYMQRMTSELQMYLLSKTPEVPDKFKRKDFIKAMIRTYLKTDIDHLTSEQRTSLYNRMPSKLRQFKETHPSEKNTKMLKSWMYVYLKGEVAKLVPDRVIKVEPGIKDEPIDYSELLDNFHEVATTSDSNGASNTVSPAQEIPEKATSSAIPQISAATETDPNKVQNQKTHKVYTNVKKFTKEKEGEVSKTPNWNSFKIPKKTVDPLQSIVLDEDHDEATTSDSNSASNNEGTPSQQIIEKATCSALPQVSKGKTVETSKTPNWNSFKIPKKTVDSLHNIDKSGATPVKPTMQPKKVSDPTVPAHNEPKDTDKKLPKPIKQRRSTTIETITKEAVSGKVAAKIKEHRLTISGHDDNTIKKAMPIGNRRLTVDCNPQRLVTSDLGATASTHKEPVPRATIKELSQQVPSKIKQHRLTLSGDDVEMIKKAMAIQKRRLTVDCNFKRPVTSVTGAPLKFNKKTEAPKESKESEQVTERIGSLMLTDNENNEDTIKKPMAVDYNPVKTHEKTLTPKETKKPEQVPKLSMKELHRAAKIRSHRLTISGHDEDTIKKAMAIQQRRLTVECSLERPVTSDAKDDPPLKTNKKTETPKEISNYDEQNTSCNVTKFFDEKVSKSNSLALEGASTAVCNYYFELNPETKFISLSKGCSVEMESRTLFELNELLYWPGVGVKIELPGITVQRYCESNVQWDLVEDENSEIPLEHLQPNKDAVFQYYDSKSDKTLASLQKEVELSHDLVRTYLEIMIKCLSVTNYAKRHEIELVLQTLLNDINKISRSFVNVSYSYFLNDHKYTRVFAQDVELSTNTKLYSLREMYNPEIVFKITRCQFQELAKVDINQMQSYFKAILVEKEPDAIEEFNVMLGKGYTLFCVSCLKNKELFGQYKCSKRIAYMSQHIGRYCAKEFDCVKCGFHSGVLGLVKDGWHHYCKDETAVDE